VTTLPFCLLPLTFLRTSGFHAVGARGPFPGREVKGTSSLPQVLVAEMNLGFFIFLPFSGKSFEDIGECRCSLLC
jgi:hypothetical protein